MSLRRALRASTSFVLALTRCGRCTLTPAAAPALTGTYPREPGSQHGLPKPVKETLGRVKDQPGPIRQGSSEAKHRVPWVQDPGADRLGHQALPLDRREAGPGRGDK